MLILPNGNLEKKAINALVTLNGIDCLYTKKFLRGLLCEMEKLGNIVLGDGYLLD